MTDEQAIAAITRTLHHATQDRADPAWTARAIITRLRQLGWRPTQAQAPPDWQHRDIPPAPPTAEYEQARDALTAAVEANARILARRTEGDTT